MADRTVPPPDGNVSHQNQLLTIIWLEITVATVVLALRVICRLKVVQGMGWDDYTMVFTWIISVHKYYLTDHEFHMALKYEWISNPLAQLAVVTGRISFAIFLLRICDTRIRRWFLIGMTGLLTAIFIPLICITLAQCSPVAALWDSDLIVQGKATCWNPQIEAVYSVAAGGYNAAVDILMALYPITILWNLQMKLRLKIGLGICMGLGLITGICACLKSYYLHELSARSDLTFDERHLIIWYTTEFYVFIVAASLPTIRPIVMLVYDRMVSFTSSIVSPLNKKSRGPSDGSEVSSAHPQKNYNSDHRFVPKVGKRDFNPFSTTCTTATLEEKVEMQKYVAPPPGAVRTLDYAELDRRRRERQSQTGSPGAIGATTEVTIKYSPENSTRTLRHEDSCAASAKARSSTDEQTLAGSDVGADSGKKATFDDGASQKRTSEEGDRPRTPDWDMKGNADPGNVV